MAMRSANLPKPITAPFAFDAPTNAMRTNTKSYVKALRAIHDVSIANLSKALVAFERVRICDSPMPWDPTAAPRRRRSR
jgi:hypothetical protein